MTPKRMYQMAAALFFRKGIEWLQAFLYRTDDITHLHSWAGTLPWYWVLTIPILGGLVVKIGSQMIDSSIRTRLNTLAMAMKG